jgi:hypothetical protein
MVKPNDDAPLSQLVTGLFSDVTGLLRKEIDLAKTEVSEKLSKAIGGIEVLLAGAVLAIGAIGVLLGALVGVLAAVMVNQGMTEVNADAAAAVIVGLLVAVVAWALVARGLAVLRGSSLNLDRTTASLRRDMNVVKEKM